MDLCVWAVLVAVVVGAGLGAGVPTHKLLRFLLNHRASIPAPEPDPEVRRLTDAVESLLIELGEPPDRTPP